MTDAAESYDRHVGRYGAQLAAGLIDAAGIEPGQRALDVGCGPGPLTRALADRLGAAQVAAVDPSEPFVEACRARVRGADVRVGAGEHLPFDDDAFDAALAQLVVQLMQDRTAGVREMARVTRPGGIVAASTWDSNAMPMLSAFWDSALAVAPERARAIPEGSRVGYADPSELSKLWNACGLEDVSSGRLLVHGEYEDFDDLFDPFTRGTGHSGRLYAVLHPAERDRLRNEAHERLGAPDGPFNLTAVAWWVRGHVR
jgi:ubiquinone/menaquinone biosynthesis C-methylase UbiE